MIADKLIRLPPKRLATILFGPFLFLHWYFGTAETPDSRAYFAVADLSPLDSQFWATLLHGRPITAVLFFSLLKDPGLIRFGHALASFAAWAYFAFQFSRLLPEATARLAFAVLFMGVLGADVMLWNRLLMSESLSISLQVTLLGLFARLIRDEPVSVWRGAVAIALLIFFTAQARDSNVLLILGAVPFLAFIAFKHPERAHRIIAAAALWAVAGSAALQLQVARDNGRFMQNIINVIGMRILPSPEKTSFFVERGLPQTDALECLRGHYYFDCGGSSGMAPIEEWARTDGPRTYVHYLLSNPLETVVTALNSKGAHLIQDMHRDQWTGYPGVRCYGTCDDLSRHIFEAATYLSVWSPPHKPAKRVVLGLVLVLTLWATYRIARHWDRLTRKEAFLLALIGYALAVGLIGNIATYHADTSEVARHMVGFALLFRLGCLMLILVGLSFRFRRTIT